MNPEPHAGRDHYARFKLEDGKAAQQRPTLVLVGLLVEVILDGGDGFGNGTLAFANGGVTG